MKINPDILFDIMAEASQRLHSEIRQAYRLDELESYLEKIGMKDLFPKEKKPLYDTLPDGKILIVGDTKLKENVISGCLKEFAIDKDRIDMRLGYDEAKNIEFKTFQYNPNYRLILFGPVPHSGKGKEEKSSIITQLETDDGYPKIIRLTDGNSLKMTKTNLKNAIKKEIISGYLVV